MKARATYAVVRLVREADTRQNFSDDCFEPEACIQLSPPQASAEDPRRLCVLAISKLVLNEDFRLRFGHSKAIGVNAVTDIGDTCRYLS